MATTLQKGLFGGDPVAMQREEQKVWSSLYGQAGSPYEKMGIALAQIGGTFFGGESALSSKSAAINKALEAASAQYQQGTAEYYKAIADALPQEYADSKDFATQKYLETKKAETTAYTDSVKAIKDNPELAPTFIDPLKISLLQKATKNGWNEAETPMPQTMDEIKAFAKQFGVDKDPMYRQMISLQQVADKEAKKEVMESEKSLLTMESIRTTISKNKADLNKMEKDAKFDQGDRWNAEREAALALFTANKIDPTKPLKGINLANTELVNAQKIALREPFTGKKSMTITPAGGTPSSAKAMTPIALPPLKSQAVIGQVYITPNGNAQWDGSKFNVVAQ
jgi:hypothetical protein